MLVCQSYITSLYEDVCGHLSFSEKDLDQYQSANVAVTYGETSYEGIEQFIQMIPFDADDVFCDLGSGVGKMAVQVFMTTPVKAVYGIEAVACRCEPALRIAAQLKHECPELFARGRRLEFRNANFLESDIHDATIVYSCSTSFGDSLLRSAAARLKQCPKLKYIASLRPLDCHLPLLRVASIKCDWEASTQCFLYGC